MIEIEKTKTVINYEKLHNEISLSTFSSKFLYVGGKSSSAGKVYIYVDTALTSGEDAELDSIITAFVDFTTAESLKIYLDNTVFPFIDDLVHKFAAENMAMGITQLGKTGDVLGLFVKQYDINTNGLPLSLQQTFDSGSLYESIKIIDHLLANTSEFAGLSPFITTQRLTDMKSEINTFLGV